MARRKKASRRRRSTAVSLLNVAESYAYANILTGGLMGTTPVGFVTGATDLGFQSQSLGAGQLGRGQTTMVAVGGGQISLGDIVSQPDQAFGIVQSNFMNNYQSMAVQSIGVGIGFKLGKRLLRRPISNVNRNIFKPLGAGFKL
tara:strand:+ start:314 stop:745 length:432 start_codon:yes stop_codon:yes gene_type:complete